MPGVPIPLLEELFTKIAIENLPMCALRTLPNGYQLLWQNGSKSVYMVIGRDLPPTINSVSQMYPGAETQYKRTDQTEILTIAKAALEWLYDEKE